MPKYECSTRAIIVLRAVSGMWLSAGTRGAAAKGVDTLVRLTPASRSLGLWMWGWTDQPGHPRNLASVSEITQGESSGRPSGFSCGWACRLSVPDRPVPGSSSPFFSPPLTPSPLGTEGSMPYHPNPTPKSVRSLLRQLPLPLPVVWRASKMLKSWSPKLQS
jgi:hypothetical protein